MDKKKYSSLAYAIAFSIGVSSFSGIAQAAEETQAVGSEVLQSESEAEAVQETKVGSSSEAAEMAESMAADKGTKGALTIPADPNRPSDEAIRNAIKEMEGQTVAEVILDGGSEQTQATASAALSMKAGDTFLSQSLDKDAMSIMNTGYFMDIYPTFEKVPEGVVLTYHLQQYPVCKGFEITGNSVETTEDLQKLITQKTDTVFNGAVFHKNMQAIEDKYHEDGYIRARVMDILPTEDGIIHVKINEGILEDYKIKGNTKTKDKVILREMRTEKGKPFNVKQAKRSIQRLQNLGFFEDVNVKVLEGVEPNAVVLEIDVKEKRTGSFGVGAGYSTADGFLGMLSLSEKNFRGTGDAVSLTYEFSGDDKDAHGYLFSYRHPWMDKKETCATLRIYDRTYRYSDYDTEGDLKEEYMRNYKGGELSFSRPVSEYSVNTITLRNREDNYERNYARGNLGDRSTPEWADWRNQNFGLTRSIIFEHATDTRDNIYMPTEGGRVAITAEIAGFGGDFNFQKASIEDTHFLKVGRAQVVAARLAYGIGMGDISEYNQYKVGGQNTLRGYRDDQFRGNRMCMASLEYRFPLVKKVQGAIFTDWGSAWDDGFVPDGFHGSIGVGVSIDTPLGPLRFDYGRGSNGGRVHFTVGGMF